MATDRPERLQKYLDDLRQARQHMKLVTQKLRRRIQERKNKPTNKPPNDKCNLSPEAP